MIEATFPGVCVLCGKRYGAGSLLVRWGGSWGHAVCVAAAENRRRAGLVLCATTAQGLAGELAEPSCAAALRLADGPSGADGSG